MGDPPKKKHTDQHGRPMTGWLHRATWTTLQMTHTGPMGFHASPGFSVRREGGSVVLFVCSRVGRCQSTSRLGSGACLPSSLFFLSSRKGFCSIMICWFLLVLARVPVLVSLLLSPFFSQERAFVPSWFTVSSWFRLGSGACLPSSLFFLSSGKGFCSIMICWFFLVPARVPVLVSILLLSFFPQESGSVPSWFTVSSWFRPGSGACLPSSPFFVLLPRICTVEVMKGSKAEGRSVPDSSMNFELHMTLVETCVVAVWGLCWCNFHTVYC